MSRRAVRRARGAVALALAAALAGCSAAGPSPGVTMATTRAPNEPVVVSTRTIDGGLLPADIGDPDEARVAALLFRGLVRYDARGKAVMEVARSIETDDDRAFTVRLADSWTFSDGSPVTARSFVDAWNFAARHSSGQYRAAAFAPILGYRAVRAAGDAAPATDDLAGLAVVDRLTFTITLSEPRPGFVSTLGDIAFSPLPASALTDPAAFARRPVGNGPYLLEGEWTPGAPEATLRPSSSYAGTDSARNAGLRFRAYTDPGQAYADLAAGRLDVLDQIPLAALATYRSDLGERAVNQPVGRAEGLVFPLASPHWAGAAGLARRTAISRALDRDALAASMFAGTRIPVTDLSAPVVEGHAPDACGERCRHDPDAARASLAAAGGLPGPLRIAYAADRQERPAVAVLCEQITQALSVACEPRPHPTLLALREAVDLGKEDAPYLETWVMRQPTLSGFLVPRFLAGAAENGSGYADAGAQAQLLAAAKAPEAQQPAAYQQVQAEILTGLPVVPLWAVNAAGASGPTVTGVRTDVFGVPVFTEITRP